MIPFADYCTRVEAHLRQTYKIGIVTRDIPDPLTGDLDGAEIHIDHLVTPEERLFLLAHLFGHTVQWNVHPRALEIGQQHEPPVAEDLLVEIVEYEREAAGYALGMLHAIGISDADQWISDYTAADMAYLMDYYRTGDKRPFRSYWLANAPLLVPKPVPPFIPVRRVFRRDGIVI